MSLEPCHSFQREIITFVERGIMTPGDHLPPGVALGWATASEGIVAGFVFTNWQRSDGVIEVSGYSTRRDWASKPIVRAIFEYPFDDLGCRMVVARHSVRNARVRRIWRALGADEVILPRMRGDDEDEAVSLFHRDQWRASRFARKD